MRKFRIGQIVGLLWEKTPYIHGRVRELPKLGVIKRLPYGDEHKLYEVVPYPTSELDRLYQFYPSEMVVLTNTTLNGDSL